MFDNSRDNNQMIYICDGDTLVIETPAGNCGIEGLVSVCRSESDTTFGSDIIFEDYFDGNLCLRIQGLMAEGFHVYIDDEEYSYAVKGGGLTNPGYALIGGPYEKNCHVRATWGQKTTGGVFYSERGTGEIAEQGTVTHDTAVELPFPVLACPAGDVFINVERGLYLLYPKNTERTSVEGLQVSFRTADGEVRFSFEDDSVYSSSLTVYPDTDGYVFHNLYFENGSHDIKGLIVARHERDYEIVSVSESSVDAFREVKGSFAGEACYRISTFSQGRDSLGSYNSSALQMYGIDRKTGYFWGKTDSRADEFRLELEEGQYEVSCSFSGCGGRIVCGSNGFDRNIVIAQPTGRGSATETTRMQVKGDELYVRVEVVDMYCDLRIDSIIVRALSTEAHPSGFVPLYSLVQDKKEDVKDDDFELVLPDTEEEYENEAEDISNNSTYDYESNQRGKKPDGIRITTESSISPKITVVGKHHSASEDTSDRKCAKRAGTLAGALALTGAVVAVFHKKK